MITAELKCPDCEQKFKLTRRSTHSGLRAKRVRCGVCRRDRNRTRRAKAERERRARLRTSLADRAPETAPIRSGALSGRHRANQGCSEAPQIGAAGAFFGAGESPG